MSGLFGAQALRSPLADVPSPKARSAHQLDAIIEAALLPETYRKARTVHRSIRPIEGLAKPPTDGFTHEVILRELDPESAAEVRDVLNAGATIGAVRHDSGSRYFVRSELHQFLAKVMHRELRLRPDEVRRTTATNDLETLLVAVLSPNEGETAEVLLHYLRPINERHGFSSEILLSDVAQDHVRAARNMLTAGSTLRVAQQDARNADRYYVHGDLYSALARIRARALNSASYHSIAPRDADYGGKLTGQSQQIEDKRSNISDMARLVDRTRSTNGRVRSYDSGSHGEIDQSVPDASIPQTVIEEFVAELGPSVEELLIGSYKDVAQRITKSILRLCDREFLFEKEISPLLRSKRDAIESVRVRLAQLNDASIVLAAQNVAKHLTDLVHLLMLAEGGDYEWVLPRLIEDAQRTSEEAFPGGLRDDWISCVQDHYEKLRRQPRRNKEDWLRVVDLLKDISDRLSNLHATEAPHIVPKHLQN
jgi:hypothetical protein